MRAFFFSQGWAEGPPIKDDSIVVYLKGAEVTGYPAMVWTMVKRTAAAPVNYLSKVIPSWCYAHFLFVAANAARSCLGPYYLSISLARPIDGGDTTTIDSEPKSDKLFNLDLFICLYRHELVV
jgi:hypothetical protein